MVRSPISLAVESSSSRNFSNDVERFSNALRATITASLESWARATVGVLSNLSSIKSLSATDEAGFLSFITSSEIFTKTLINGRNKAVHITLKKVWNIAICVAGNVNGNDIGSGFKNDWVQMLEINEFIAPKGTQETVNELIGKFRQNKIQVFCGDYLGVDPYDPSDTIDLKDGYNENADSSAPSFHYILQDVITIE